jgi:adenylate kinase
MKYPTFLFFGAPGSGKGTHGRILGSIPGFCHLACGDVFRSLDMESPLGKAFADYSSRGQLVPDSLVMELWQSQMKALVASGRYKPGSDYLVLDGIPRNVAQAQLLVPFLEVKKVFHLTCPNEGELVRRMRRRALKDNRLDDADEKVIRSRLVIYKNETLPVLEYYGARKTVTVYTTKNPHEVFREILGQIDIPCEIREAEQQRRDRKETLHPALP